MIELNIPISEDDIRSLKLGDEVSLNGVILTGRDAAHTWLIEKKRDDVAELLQGSVIYHCGPVVKKDNDEWSFVAAGPTTSIREEPYQAEVIEKYALRAVIGKGGMGDKTSAGLQKSGAVYLHAVGGAASLIAQSVIKVHDVFMLEEFGVPEAMWVIEVKNFKCIVTMDANGNSLHKEIKTESAHQADKLLR